MKRILVDASLICVLLLASSQALAQQQCTVDEQEEAGCNMPEVCRVEVSGRSFRHVRCTVEISESVSSWGCHNPDSSVCVIEWDGLITPDSVDALLKFIDTIPIRDELFGGPSLEINSEGGDVRAALQLGRKLRERNADVQPSYCASACVLVLAGASQRTVFDSKSEIVIHRPYNLNVNEYDVQQTQDRYDQLNSEIEKYLREMNVPTSLLDAMLVIPPQRGRRLSRDELQQYLLDQDDPVYEQARNARIARKKGLTMTEYLRRKSLEEQCTHRHYIIDEKTYSAYYCYEVMDTGRIGVDNGPKSIDQIIESLKKISN